MPKVHIPDSIRQFVEQRKTKPVKDLLSRTHVEDESPYGSHWWRAVACILLSGRVQAKSDGAPNMTDVNRIGKEANFNQYLIERVGNFLIAMDAIQFRRRNEYEPGPNLAAFWDHDAKRLPAIAQQGVLRLARYKSGQPFWSFRPDEDSHLIVFLSLFFESFRGLALVESEVGPTFQDFSQLPEHDLIAMAQGLGLTIDDSAVAGWRKRLDAKGQTALIAAVNIAVWAYGTELRKTDWYYASATGLAMLGLGEMPSVPKLATEFKVQNDLSVFAGAGLAWEKLVPLFRYGTIKRIDQVFEFRLNRKRMAQSSATEDPGKVLGAVLRESGSLPATVENLLGTKPKTGGKIGIRACSALLKPEDAETLKAIQEHPRLKGYLEPGAPPGYLILKSQSDPNNFVARCQDLGFNLYFLSAVGSEKKR